MPDRFSQSKYLGKVLALTVCSALAISLAACGADNSGQTSDAQTSSQEQTFASQTQEVPDSEDTSVAEESTEYSGEYGDAVSIVLSESGAEVDGEAAGTDSSAAVYTGNDIVYYEDRDSYDSGNPYGEGTANERHSAEEAAANTVVYITELGTYRLSGTLHGQVRVDLGKDAAEDPDAVVTLVFDRADITCDVAPAVIFVNVYECDGDSSTETATSDVDTSAAGANVIIADGSVNNIEGSHIARIYKDDDQQKKLVKQDGAFYSCMSMNIDGGEKSDGVLNITADNEGLDTELHLTINGGIINIFSQDDGINTNEDGISVTTINGGEVHIISGLGLEGDGVDSNGWLVINGGTVVACANPASDSGLDSDLGSYINGGTVVALGSTMDWADSDSKAVTINLQFASYEDANESIVVTDLDGNTIFEFDPAEDAVLKDNARKYMGAVISCPEFAVGDSYYVYVGGIQQSYTGTDVVMGPGGMGHGGLGGGMGSGGIGGERPEMAEGEFPEMQGERPEMPDGGFPEMDGERPEMPDGGFEMQGERPDQGGFMPSGGQPGRGGFTPGETGADQSSISGEQNNVFIMGDAVNAFSGVADHNAD